MDYIRKNYIEDDYEDSYYDDYRGEGSSRYDDDDYHRNIPEAPKTKKDAENVIQEAKTDKKFWNYNEIDNSKKLQGAINILFNCKAGNDYKVEFNDNQTGTRLIINCYTCNKILSSIDPFISHEQGKAHRKAQTAVLQPKDPNLSVPLKERKLNEPRNIFAEDSLEEMIDETDKTAIGVHFAYKEVIDEETLYTCTLCEKERPVKRIKKEVMFKHLTNEFHIRKYLMVKFGYAKKGTGAMEYEAKQMEEFEG
ncbi:unnamed protein product [Meganyctiphanes norvegica]|uniref:C2H2-type domain-containing protein n=1 Tax=Meganyctiphanes norvegica TaxID=48144 RepID=A0AAV2S0S6_MEGNR